MYRRTVAEGGHLGTIEVRDDSARQCLVIAAHFPIARSLRPIVARTRRVFDVRADIETIGAHLSRDPLLRPLVTARPGLRSPGAWDGFELGVRAILGQQIAVVAARRLGSRLVAICGDELPEMANRDHGLTRVVPSPERVALSDLGALGMPTAHRETLKAMARAAIADPSLFRPNRSARLRTIAGVGE